METIVSQIAPVAKAIPKVDSPAKPVLKWAGGKTQLLPALTAKYPKNLGTKITKYIEPFFGGGAVFFDLYNSNYIKEAIILDANPELILLYKIIKKQPDQLVENLQKLQKKYLLLKDSDREEFYYKVRDDFNSKRKNSYTKLNSIRASQIIFLNRTCFNGLFRVNSKGGFNVPYGNYKNPKILDSENIYAVSKAFQIAEILQSDFENIFSMVKSNDVFIYYDPPYRPLTDTSNFNAYTGVFNDSHQVRLADIFKKMNEKGIYQMLSNSDPMSATGDDFFDKLYQDFNIFRVEAKRMINSNTSKRGKIFELLITNYKED
ncbi:DNA adenine methylase [Pigmentibacter sp. JX0631]|uniref:DNA adenine methylase n=1 Tax=Pigmentibacter sp. JX0631 TaxID=2976982 RepID=UPI0024696B20|nr:DNA adenine methylase [Pigmentibacter sp. JX0631]WGL60506.1 DNA adenine methylase [Pigmentibacter sp. JX0631]